MAKSFLSALKYRGLLRGPREAGFTDIEEVDGCVRAWSPDGLAGVAFVAGDDDGIEVWAINRAGLPVAEAERQDAWSATHITAEEWSKARTDR